MNKENTLKSPHGQALQDSKTGKTLMNLGNKPNNRQIPTGASKSVGDKIPDKSVKLPSLGNKFSSWNNTEASLNELDELLMEHDLLMNPGDGSTPNKHEESRESQPEEQIDFEEVMDELGEDLSGQDNQSPLQRKRGSVTKKEKNDDLQGSFDLDNSDQLNDIIQKYENMLGDDKAE